MREKKLNLGCGTNIKSGWINLDCVDLPGLDTVHNIVNLPLPFADEQSDVTCCDSVFEHIEYIPVLRDIHRISEPGGYLTIRVPHLSSHTSSSDPTHKKMFSIDTFNFFVGGLTNNDYYFDFHFSRIPVRKIRFLKSGIFWLNRLVEPLVNCSSSVQYFYESTCWCRLLPANHIVVELIK